jgi:hypothetical protein
MKKPKLFNKYLPHGFNSFVGKTGKLFLELHQDKSPIEVWNIKMNSQDSL